MDFHKKNTIYLLLFIPIFTACEGSIDRMNTWFFCRADSCITLDPGSALHYLQQAEKYVPLHIQYSDSIYLLSQGKGIPEIQGKSDRDLLVLQNKIKRLPLFTDTLLLLLLLLIIIIAYHIKKYRRYRYTKELELLTHKKNFQTLEALYCELKSEFARYHFADKNGRILEDQYKVVVTHYCLYNPRLVHFLRDPNLVLTPYEVILCVFSYEHMPMERMGEVLGKSRGTLNKAISRAKDKLFVVARKDGLHKVGDLGAFLREKF